MSVLDLGCGPGEYLRHFAAGSVGLDLNPEQALAAGLDARVWNFTEPFDDELGRFDAVWCSNLIEHVLSPHEFLIEIRRVLKKDGLLLLVAPRTNRLSRSVWRGYLAADHVNFFTPRTLLLTIERAGYDVEFLGAPSLPHLPLRVAGQVGRIAPVLLAACRIQPHFQYPAKTGKRLVHGAIAWKSDATA